MAKQHLHANKVALLIVGEKMEILLNQPDHPFKLGSLVSDKVLTWPSLTR